MHGMPLKVHNNFTKPMAITSTSKKLCAGVMLDRLSLPFQLQTEKTPYKATRQ